MHKQHLTRPLRMKVVRRSLHPSQEQTSCWALREDRRRPRSKTCRTSTRTNGRTCAARTCHIVMIRLMVLITRLSKRSAPWYRRARIMHETHCLGAICKGRICAIPSAHMRDGVVQVWRVVITQRRAHSVNLLRLAFAFFVSLSWRRTEVSLVRFEPAWAP